MKSIVMTLLLIGLRGFRRLRGLRRLKPAAISPRFFKPQKLTGAVQHQKTEPKTKEIRNGSSSG
jgi:hypothetical protein